MSNDELRNELARLRGHLAGAHQILKDLALELEAEFMDDLEGMAQNVHDASAAAQELELELEE